MLCKKIKRRGGAEQYHADKKCEEAIAVAAEACAEDTAGQTCYICTQAVHWKTKEGLVRMCACRGTAGFAHVSCLAEQAKILVAEAEENNSDDLQWHRWNTCSLCEQKYYGVVRCALGWACWRTYVGRPEVDWARRDAMMQLGNGLADVDHHEDALPVREAELAIHRRLGLPEENILGVQTNLALTYSCLGRKEESLRMRRDVYYGRLKLHGEENESTLETANNYAWGLCGLKRFEEAKALLRKPMRVARRVLGENHELTLVLSWAYARALYSAEGATLDNLREAVTTLEKTERIARRVLGGAHPTTTGIDDHLRNARTVLRAREAGHRVIFTDAVV